MRLNTFSLVTSAVLALSSGSVLGGTAFSDQLSPGMADVRVAVDVDVRLSGKAPHLARLKTEVITDPGVNPPEPNGPGQRNMTQNVYANCATVMINGSPTSANITWTWRYSPTTDTNHDGRVNSNDQCPCAWVNQGYQVEQFVNNEPLQC